MKNRKKEYKRVQFDFSPKSIDRLDELVEITESSSRAEVIRKALEVYGFLGQKVRDGFSIELSKGETKETIAPLPL